MEPNNGIAIPHKLGSAVVKVVLVVVLVVKEVLGRWIGTVVGHLEDFVSGNRLSVEDHRLGVVFPIPKTPNVGPHKDVALEKVHLDGLRDAPGFAEPDPKQLIGSMYAFLGISIQLVLPEFLRVHTAPRQIVQVHGNNDGPIRGVLPILLDLVHKGGFRKDDHGVLQAEHVGHPALVFVGRGFRGDLEIARHDGVGRLYEGLVPDIDAFPFAVFLNHGGIQREDVLVVKGGRLVEQGLGRGELGSVFCGYGGKGVGVVAVPGGFRFVHLDRVCGGIGIEDGRLSVVDHRDTQDQCRATNQIPFAGAQFPDSWSRPWRVAVRVEIPVPARNLGRCLGAGARFVFGHGVILMDGVSNGLDSSNEYYTIIPRFRADVYCYSRPDCHALVRNQSSSGEWVRRSCEK